MRALRLRQATTREATVPSQIQLSQIAGNFPASDSPNPAGQAIFNLYPAANVGADLTNSNTFVSAPVIRNTENLGTDQSGSSCRAQRHALGALGHLRRGPVQSRSIR